MLSGKLPPPPQLGPLDPEVDNSAARIVTRTSVSSSLVSQGHTSSHGMTRTRGAHGHGHGHSQTERMIAAVARSIVVSSEDGTEVEDVVMGETTVFVTAASDVDDADDGDTGADPGAEPGAGIQEAGNDLDDFQEIAQARDGSSEDDLRIGELEAPDTVGEAGMDGADEVGADAANEASANEGGQRAGAADSNGSGGHGGGGGSSSQAGGVDTAQRAAAIAVLQTSSPMSTARIERVKPPQAPRRAAPPREQPLVQIVGIGVIAAVILLVLAILVSHFSSSMQSSQEDEQGESESER